MVIAAATACALVVLHGNDTITTLLLVAFALGFPEGPITTDGQIHSFRPGIEKNIERNPVPVIPVALCGPWGSWFSRQTDGGIRKIPGKLSCRVEVRIGDPVRPDDVTAGKLELLVRTLGGITR